MNISNYDEFMELNESYLFLSKNEIENLSSVGYRGTGIKGITFWFGVNKEYNTPVVKVGNVLDNISAGINNCFTIILPDIKVVGVDKKVITDDILNDIKKFIHINKKCIVDFSLGVIEDDYDFFKKLKKI